MSQNQPSEPQSSDAANALSVVINQTGFPDTIKGRLQKWVARFITGTLAHPAYRQMRENLDTVEGRTRVNMIVADEIGRQIIADPVYMEQAKARFVGDFVRKHDNVEAIARQALALVDDSTQEAPDGSSENEEPNDDWINAFTRAAEDASSEDLRARLAKLLAKESRKPGTFSKATIRMVAEMETDTLKNLKELLSMKVWDSIPVEESWRSGDYFTRGLELENLGILSGVTGTSYKNFIVPSTGEAAIVDGNWSLTFKASPNLEIRFNAWILSRVGNELAMLLGPFDARPPLERLSRLVPKSAIEAIYTGPFISTPHGDRAYKSEQIYASSAPQPG